jgi:hypothetical protein
MARKGGGPQTARDRACVYPFGEALAGVLMISGVLRRIAAPAAFVIGDIGAVSVFTAVCLDRRELTCAGMGGTATCRFGFVSLTENLMMVAMAIWTAVREAGSTASGPHKKQTGDPFSTNIEPSFEMRGTKSRIEFRCWMRPLPVRPHRRVGRPSMWPRDGESRNPSAGWSPPG